MCGAIPQPIKLDPGIIALFLDLQFLQCCQRRRYSLVTSLICFILDYIDQEIKEFLGILLL